MLTFFCVYTIGFAILSMLGLSLWSRKLTHEGKQVALWAVFLVVLFWPVAVSSLIFLIIFGLFDDTKGHK